MGVRRLLLTAVLSLCASGAGLVFASTPVLAISTHEFSFSFAGAGSESGKLSSPAGVAVNLTTHDVYVADPGNYRVDEFEQNGTFIRAWGWGVADGLPTLEECSLSCEKGLPGSGLGQFQTPEFVAVDNSTGPSAGDVYVGDTGDNLVTKFDASGALISGWGTKGQLDGSSATDGPFGSVDGLAVDPSGVLMVVSGSSRMFEFAQDGNFNADFEIARGTSAAGLAVAPNGDFFKINGLPSVEAFTSSGIDLGQTTAAKSATGLAIDATSGDLYVDEGEGRPVSHYAFTAGKTVSEQGGATCTFKPESGCSATDSFGLGRLSSGSGIGVDPATGSVYVADQSANQIDVFTPAVLPDVKTEPPSNKQATSATFNGTVNLDKRGSATCQFDWGTSKSFGNVAPCSAPVEAEGDVPVSVGISGLQPNTTYYYRLQATNADGTRVADPAQDQEFTTPQAVDAVSTGPAEDVKLNAAKLTGSLSPDGKDAHYYFQYGTTTEYGSTSPAAPGTDAGTVSQSVPAETVLSGLKEFTVYHYRLVAVNSDGTTYGEDREFLTLGAGIDEESVSDVASSSATLNARVNPNRTLTTVYFQYGTSPAYGSEVPAGPGEAIGSGEDDVVVNPRHLQGLSAGTLYHYRVVAISELEVEGKTEPLVFDGPDQTFTTQSIGRSTLPDGRQWELVSPPDKHGAVVEPISATGLDSGGVVQSSADGTAITYATDAPTEADARGYSNLEQVLSTRGAEGWVSHDIGLSNEVATGASIGNGAEYRFFTEDLSLAVVQPFGSTIPSSSSQPLSSEASEQTAFLRTNYPVGDISDQCSNSCYRPLVTGAPGVANVPPGTVFAKDPNSSCPPFPICGPLFVGASPDGKHVILSSYAALTPTAPNGGGLYEWTAGKLTFVGSGQLGRGSVSTRHAVSNDGSRVFWATESGERHLYMSDMVKKETVQVGMGEDTFQIASSDGSSVFFTEGGDLKVCEIIEEAGELKCNLTDLTPGGAAQGGVLGASEDGSYVYFVADGVFASGAVPGKCDNSGSPSPPGAMCNLYLRHAGTTKLVAVLSALDEPDWGKASGSLVVMTARVSSDGRWLAFMSQRDLTGYETRDALSSIPDEEVYLYDAQTAKLVCASCNPTGAQPVGVEYGNLEGPNRLIGGEFEWETTSWLAANIPGWTRYSLSAALYQSRYLSDNGRLFFNSNDALVPQDVNGTWDVYEYEPPGVSDCTTSSVGFSERSDGCVNLVSSGSSGEESAFLDASATGGKDAEGHEGGGHVFFLTSAKLVGQDFDKGLDVYDAYECSSVSPCFAVSAAVPPPCTTGDACKPAPSPQPAIFGSPASATFSGAGNVVIQASSPLVAPRGLTRAQKLARALKGCHKKKGKGRVLCERQARARYVIKRAGKANASKRGRG